MKSRNRFAKDLKPPNTIEMFNEYWTKISIRLNLARQHSALFNTGGQKRSTCWTEQFWMVLGAVYYIMVYDYLFLCPINSLRYSARMGTLESESKAKKMVFWNNITYFRTNWSWEQGWLLCRMLDTLGLKLKWRHPCKLVYHDLRVKLRHFVKRSIGSKSTIGYEYHSTFPWFGKRCKFSSSQGLQRSF